jgi:glutamyl-tRNA reductase
VTSIGCLSVTSCRASLSVLERLSFSGEELVGALPGLVAAGGVDQLVVVSTCERVELYGVWGGVPDLDRLVGALAADRGVSVGVVDAAVGRFVGVAAVRHLFRVTAGLESFVVGERDVVGQVRAAAELSRRVGVGGLVVDRLMGAAVAASRRAHRRTGFVAAGRSVAGAAVEVAAGLRGGSLVGCRLVVVGAGQMAGVVVERAVGLGAVVTVCNRTRRRAERFVAAGAVVADLADLGRCLGEADVVLVSTAAPHPLVDRVLLEGALAGRPRAGRAGGSAGAGLLVLDLCLPRNVDVGVRAMAGVRLVDLADLRGLSSADVGALAADVAVAGEVVRVEADRFVGWVAARPAAEAVRRLREDSEAIAREELDRLCRLVPAELHELVEQGVARVARRLAHGPTRTVLAAARAGDPDLVELLAAQFAPTDPRTDEH